MAKLTSNGSPSDEELIASSTGKAEQQDSVRSRILRGAVTTFGRVGYENASVEAVLEEAGVSRRTFYKHFRSKEDVFRALYDRAVERLLVAVRTAEVPFSGGVAARVKCAVEAYIRVHEKAGPLARVMLLEQFAPGSPLAAQRDEAMESFSRLISNAARKAGVTDLDPILVSAVVAGINRVCIQIAAQAGTDHWDTDRAMRAISRLLRALEERP